MDTDGTKVSLILRLRREFFACCTKRNLHKRDWQRVPEALVSFQLWQRFSTRRAEVRRARFPSGSEPEGIGTVAEMERCVEGRTASSLFAGFRALGLFSNDIPHVVRFSSLKRRFYVTTCVGKSFHTYDVSDFFAGFPRTTLPGSQIRPGAVPALASHLPRISLFALFRSPTPFYLAILIESSC